MNSLTSPQFWQQYRLLPPSVRQAARAAYQQFIADLWHPGLKFHKLHRYPNLWAVRITRTYRAVGLVSGNAITWFWIGSHQDFDKAFPP